MKIAVLGASGKVGRLVVEDALRRGHTVNALIHKTQLDLDHPNLSTYPELKYAVNDVDAVISALGSWKSRGHNTLSTTMSALVPIMEKIGPRRIVSLTGADAWIDSDTPGFLNGLSHSIIMAVSRGVLADGEKHIEILAESTLDWTVVRSPVMTNSTSVAYRLQKELLPPYLLVSRVAVAGCLLDLAETEAQNKTVIGIRQG
jgi:putative NADH-flavin reductase